ncbi:alpha/beta hydrolase [Bradyrhizobium sp.]|uniref:alpha/beta fold hydrolase n=1 Tax=Bradyrhizobium sp. TaxID=376 RepID=UPI001DCD6955|nr:alpha/beta hydrolase [Bradyrhizobium sp.]MBI5318710.1 alpha/beta hydrolase [Bradyrhizobium sp.]
MTFLLGLILLLAVIIAGLVWFTSNTARRVEALLPPRGQFMDIDGQRIHYTDTGGTKPAIVMIHGLGGNLLHFGYAMADKLTNDYRVILVDRPGAGYSTRPEDAPATLTAQAKTIATLIRRLDLKQPLVVGHSLGGALSLAIALDHPDCAGGLALIAPLTHAREDVPEAFQGLVIASPLVRKAIAWTLATPLGIRRGPKLLAEVFAPEAVPADFPMRAGGLLGLRPSAFYNTSTDLMAAGETLPGYMARYKSLDIPMAMLFGRGDRILDYRGQGEAMKIVCPALDLELMEGGHMLPMTAPDRCVALVRRVAERQQGMQAA